MKLLQMVLFISCIRKFIDSFHPAFHHRSSCRIPKNYALYSQYNPSITSSVDISVEKLLSHMETNILRSTFGLEELKPSQRTVIERILLGHSTLAIFPTGFGKSLLYMLPATILDGLTIVVSPLLALMRDQVDYLKSKGIGASRIDSTLTFDQVQLAITDLNNGKTKLLYVSPERFNNEKFRKLISNIKVSLFVVDEAHCVSEWGHAFRPEYLRLSKFSSFVKAPIRLALTATATNRVSDDIAKSLDIHDDNIIRLPSLRTNLKLKVVNFFYPNDSYYYRLQKLLDILRFKSSNDKTLGATIIYVNKQNSCEVLVKDLISQGYVAKAYHAGMETNEREQVEHWFLNQDRQAVSDDDNVVPSPIVVGTIAFGMGVDRKNVRNVIHYDLSRSIEDWVQGIGRAGRDGIQSSCIAFYANSDVAYLRNQIYGITPTYNSLEKLVDFILSSDGDGYPCAADDKTVYLSYYDMAQLMDVSELSIRLAMSHLVHNDILTELTASYRVFKIGPVNQAIFDTYVISNKADRSSSDFSASKSDVDLDFELAFQPDSSNNNENTNSYSLKSSKITDLVKDIKKMFVGKTGRTKWVSMDVFELANNHNLKPSVILSLLTTIVSENICPYDGVSKIYSRFQFVHKNNEDEDKRILVDVDANTGEDYIFKSNSNSKKSKQELVDMLFEHAMETRRRALVRVDEIASLLSLPVNNDEEVNNNEYYTEHDDYDVNIDQMLWNRIAAYFNESSMNMKKPVIHEISTSGAVSQYTKSLQSNCEFPVDESVWDRIEQLVLDKSLPSDDPLLIARFATGVFSPRIKKLKLGKLDAFGSCVSNDWLDIIQRSSELLQHKRMKKQR